MSENIAVSHYGVHWLDAGIAWLEQNQSSNAIGYKGRSPFVVTPEKRSNARCNHNVNLSSQVPDSFHLEIVEDLMSDPFFRLFVPIPRDPGDRCHYVEDATSALRLHSLIFSKMSSPVHPIISDVVKLSHSRVQDTLIDKLSTSNVQPFVIDRVRIKDSEGVAQLAAATVANPRTLILMGERDVVMPPSCRRVETDILRWKAEDLLTMPWESIGAHLLKRYMRKDTKPLVRREP